MPATFGPVGRLLRHEAAPGDGHHAGEDDSRQHPRAVHAKHSWEEHALDEPARAGQRDDDRAYHRQPSGGRPAVHPAARAAQASGTKRELAELDAEVEAEQRPAQRVLRQAELAQDRREAEAVDQPEQAGHPRPEIAAGRRRVADQQVVDADQHDAQRDERLDERRRRSEDAQRRQRQGDRVAEREGGDDEPETPERPAQKQQADQEQQVVGPNRRCGASPAGTKVPSTAPTPCHEPA